METKKVIRKEIFRRRKEASLTSVRENSEQIWQKLFSLPAFQESDWIYLYIDCKNEVMTAGIIEEAFRLGKKVAAPKVVGEDFIRSHSQKTWNRDILVSVNRKRIFRLPTEKMV